MRTRGLLAKTMAIGLLAAATGAAAAAVKSGIEIGASGIFIDAKGNTVGEAQLTEGVHGVILRVELRGLPPGWHGLHLHSVGTCKPPSFTSAGEHFNPAGVTHGFLNADGVHAGDLANIHVREDGTAKAEMVSNLFSLGAKQPNILDADGAALVVHARPDDYRTVKSAGDRIACAVLHKVDQSSRPGLAPGEK